MIRSKVGPDSQGIFITLHAQGEFDRECIDNGTLQLLRTEVPHQVCIDALWTKAVTYFSEPRHVATQHVIQQLRMFYESPESTLWVTADTRSLFWCFAEPNVSVLEDGSRVRKSLGGWSNKDMLGCPLLLDRVDQHRLQIRNHVSAISRIGDVGYLIDLINGNTASSSIYHKDK